MRMAAVNNDTQEFQHHFLDSRNISSKSDGGEDDDLDIPCHIFLFIYTTRHAEIINGYQSRRNLGPVESLVLFIIFKPAMVWKCFENS